MTIYTRGGDGGQTSLFGGDRVMKHHHRVAAYGNLDELNCALGAARSAAAGFGKFKTLDDALQRIQAEVFVIGAILATPPQKLPTLGAPFNGGFPPDASLRLEREIDSWDKKLPPLKTFILPGGCTAGAALHMARAVCRRAERSAVELNSEEPLPNGVIAYMNRLSTWLFVAARWVNHEDRQAETPWVGLPRS